MSVSFAAGILAASTWTVLPRWFAAVTVGAPCIAMVLCWAARRQVNCSCRRVRRVVWGLLLLGVFFCGSLRYLMHVSSVAGGPLLCDEERAAEVVVTAAGNPEPTSAAGGLRWEAEILPSEDRQPAAESGFKRDLIGHSVMVFSDRQSIKAGGVYRVQGTITRPRAARNPGVFDYRQYLLHQGVGYVLYAEDVSQLRAPPAWSIARLRQQLGRRIYSSLTPAAEESIVGIVLALTLGIRDSIPQSLLQDFRTVGLGHLLAVSGMHLAIFGMGMLHLCYLVMSKHHTPVVAIPALVIYCCLVGGRPSVWRAAAVFAGWLCSQLAAHRIEPLNTLGGAALLLLVANPGTLFDIGFQLSFAACWGLVCIGPRINAWMSHLIGNGPLQSYLVPAMSASTAAYLTTVGLILYHFGESSLLALMINPLFVPLLAPMMIGAWIAALWASFGLPAVVPYVATRPLAFLTAVVRWLAGASTGYTVTLRPMMLLFVYSSLWASFPPPREVLLEDQVTKLQTGKLRFLRTARLLLLWLVVLLLVWTAPHPGGGFLRVTLFDVRQGDCLLIEEPGGKTVLIDTGPPDWSGDDSILQREVLPYLLSRGISSIDYLLLTHSHLDHIGGADDLLCAVDAENIWLPTADRGRKADGVCPDVWGQWAEEYSDRIRWVYAGDDFEVGCVNVEVLWPPSEVDPRLDLNERSMAVRISYGDWTMLAMGDVEGLGEHMLVHKLRGQLSASALKVGHHGARRSSGEDFLGQVRPQVALIPVGVNPYGMPCADTIRRLEASGARVLSTKRAGAIILHTDGTRWWLQTMLYAAAD